MGDRTATAARGVADLSVDWCTDALGAVLEGGRVVDVSTTAVGTGQVADTVRLTLTYDPPSSGPATLVAKVPAADAASRAAARLTRTYEIEASFFRDLAPAAAVRAPRCYDAAYDPVSDDYHVLLEDVAPAEQGDQLAGCPLGDIEDAVDELALLHGPRWGDETLLDIGWLHRTQPQRIDETVALIGQCVAPFLQRFGARLEPATVAVVERFTPRVGAYLHGWPRPWTIIHGDYRADNLLFGGDRVVVVDWQTVGLGPGPFDLAYLLGASVVPDDRRRHERDLVARYVEGVRAHGVQLDDEVAWTEYRRCSFGSLLMAIVAPMLVKQTERGDEMFIAMADRPARQIADLDAESLLAD
ncbi:MAG: phosphotransferase [Actinomycetota bacterium]|nr:phosphotransferase [Actinomycetota bacterium]